jgi:F-type H+-transporting ATPase subunit b
MTESAWRPLRRFAAVVACVTLIAATAGKAGAAGSGVRGAAAVAVVAAADPTPYDLSAGDASPDLENPIEWRYDMALASFVMFLVLLALLSKLAWRPVLTGLDKRERSIMIRIADAERTAADAAEQLRQCEAHLSAAHKEAEAIVAAARAEGQAVAETLRQAGRQEAEQERERILAEVQVAKEAAMREVSQRAAELAVLLAGQILRRELKAEDHRGLIHDALEQFPSPE